MSDAELFRAFPELKGEQRLLTYALLYWRHGIIVDEFRKDSIWLRCKKAIIDGFRRFYYGVRAA